MTAARRLPFLVAMLALAASCSSHRAARVLRDRPPARESASEEVVVAVGLDGAVTEFSAAGLDHLGFPVDAGAFVSSLSGGDPDWNTERYDAAPESGFRSPLSDPLSTFSIDVDTASYSNVRRFLEEGVRPPRGAVRIEELVNYFRFDWDAEPRDAPFAVTVELAEAPWAAEHLLLRVGLRGEEVDERDLPPRNLVFLVDVSGSMEPRDKLPLLRRALGELVLRLRAEDRVAIAVYAGAAGLVLPPTPGSDRARILDALDRLHAGGSTNGGEGIRLAYRVARRHFDPGGVNRVILATDGDFNVGVSSRSELVDLIERERESGVFLSVLGVGRGNLNDAALEQLADRGNGNYSYLDGLAEARKVLVEQAGGTLVTIAKNVKLQIEFNPYRVAGYRLIGYENRRLEDRDFDDDRVDAGEIGAGHSVTAFYEIVPVGAHSDADPGDAAPLVYQRPGALASRAFGDEWLTLALRYTPPDEDESRLVTRTLAGEPLPLDRASADLRFGSAVALFGMLLRQSRYAGDADWELVRALARGGLDDDALGWRAGFVELVDRAAALGPLAALE